MSVKRTQTNAKPTHGAEIPKAGTIAPATRVMMEMDIIVPVSSYFGSNC